MFPLFPGLDTLILFSPVQDVKRAGPGSSIKDHRSLKPGKMHWKWISLASLKATSEA